MGVHPPVVLASRSCPREDGEAHPTPLFPLPPPREDPIPLRSRGRGPIPLLPCPREGGDPLPSFPLPCPRESPILPTPPLCPRHPLPSPVPCPREGGDPSPSVIPPPCPREGGDPSPSVIPPPVSSRRRGPIPLPSFPSRVLAKAGTHPPPLFPPYSPLLPQSPLISPTFTKKQIRIPLSQSQAQNHQKLPLFDY